MIKTYYRFALDKEALITTEQGSYGGFTCVTGIYVDTEGTPDVSSTTVEYQDGTFIAKGIDTVDEDDNPIKRDLTGFVVEKLRSQPLQGQFYEKFYIG